jgi:hypothetical protein
MISMSVRLGISKKKHWLYRTIVGKQLNMFLLSFHLVVIVNTWRALFRIRLETMFVFLFFCFYLINTNAAICKIEWDSIRKASYLFKIKTLYCLIIVYYIFFTFTLIIDFQHSQCDSHYIDSVNWFFSYSSVNFNLTENDWWQCSFRFSSYMTWSLHLCLFQSYYLLIF